MRRGDETSIIRVKEGGNRRRSRMTRSSGSTARRHARRGTEARTFPRIRLARRSPRGGGTEGDLTEKDAERSEEREDPGDARAKAHREPRRGARVR